MLNNRFRPIAGLIKRDIIEEIRPWLFDDHILVIIGPRQAGKTSLLHLLSELLLKEGKVTEERIYYFDLEDINLLSFFNASSPAEIAAQFGKSTKKIFLFIDEIQYLKNPSNFLKIVHDHFPHLKLIVSGSSTLEIKKKFKESLAGRKKIFILRTLNFSEFLRFKNSSLIKIKSRLNWKEMASTSSLQKKNFLDIFEEFVVFGSYPKVALEQNRDKKIDELSEIYNSYLRKDIKDFGAVENIEAFNKLVSLLAFQIGQLVNLEELTLNLRLSRKTVERYVFLLENTFAVRFIRPYFSNKRKELSKMPKVYFEDTGLRNIATRNFDSLSLRADSGPLFENAIFGTLMKNLKVLEELKFWRTQAGAEVDLIIEGKKLLPVEVKYRSFKQPQIPLGLKNFIQTYNLSEALVINRDFHKKINFKGAQVYFIPGFYL
jgi:predicted AAA+ superfamily ATPase